MSYTFTILIYGITVAAVTLFLDLFNFRGFHRGIGRVNIFANFLLIFWPLLDILNLRYQPPYQLLLSQIATIALSTSMYLKHYFYDELSATYRQRKTMTLASVIYGGVLAAIWYDNVFLFETDRILVSPFLVLLLLLQGGLLTDRIIKHLKNQSKLSTHYNISSIFNRRNTFFFMFLLTLLFIFGMILLALNQFSTESIPFVFLVTTGYVFTSILTIVDPLSSLPLSQPVVAIAHISEDQSFRYVFSSEDSPIMQQEMFSQFITQITDLLKEMTASQTKIVSFSSRDFLVMFEPTNQGVLLMLLQKRTPVMRHLLHILAQKISKTTLTSEIQFSSIIKQTLTLPNTSTLHDIIDRVSEFVIVFNEKAAGYKRTRKRWKVLVEKNTSIPITELNPEWILENRPRGLLILGGDGTVHSVCNTVIRSGLDIPVSILPGGGGNDIYKRWMQRDLGSYNKDGWGEFPVFEVHYPDGKVVYAINSVEWGIGALVATRRENNEAKFLAGMPKYFYLLLKSLVKYKSWSSNLVIDGKTEIRPDLSAVVIGFGSSSMGGGYLMFPDEVSGQDESQLFALIAKGFQKFSGLSLIMKLARSKQYLDSRVVYVPVTDIEMLPNGMSVPITIDGELYDAPPVQITGSNKRVKVLKFE